MQAKEKHVKNNFISKNEHWKCDGGVKVPV